MCGKSLLNKSASGVNESSQEKWEEATKNVLFKDRAQLIIRLFLYWNFWFDLAIRRFNFVKRN